MRDRETETDSLEFKGERVDTMCGYQDLKGERVDTMCGYQDLTRSLAPPPFESPASRSSLETRSWLRGPDFPINGGG